MSYDENRTLGYLDEMTSLTNSSMGKLVRAPEIAGKYVGVESCLLPLVILRTLAIPDL
jgi:hypothetical protein